MNMMRNSVLSLYWGKLCFLPRFWSPFLFLCTAQYGLSKNSNRHRWATRLNSGERCSSSLQWFSSLLSASCRMPLQEQYSWRIMSLWWKRKKILLLKCTMGLFVSLIWTVCWIQSCIAWAAVNLRSYTCQSIFPFCWRKNNQKIQTTPQMSERNMPAEKEDSLKRLLREIQWIVGSCYVFFKSKSGF